jgi:hypothetical protein
MLSSWKRPVLRRSGRTKRKNTAQAGAARLTNKNDKERETLDTVAAAVPIVRSPPARKFSVVQSAFETSPPARRWTAPYNNPVTASSGTSLSPRMVRNHKAETDQACHDILDSAEYGWGNHDPQPQKQGVDNLINKMEDSGEVRLARIEADLRSGTATPPQWLAFWDTLQEVEQQRQPRSGGSPLSRSGSHISLVVGNISPQRRYEASLGRIHNKKKCQQPSSGREREIQTTPIRTSHSDSLHCPSSSSTFSSSLTLSSPIYRVSSLQDMSEVSGPIPYSILSGSDSTVAVLPRVDSDTFDSVLEEALLEQKQFVNS